MERIEGLLVDRSIPSIRKHSEPLLFIHGMWGVLEWLERAMK